MVRLRSERRLTLILLLLLTLFSAAAQAGLQVSAQRSKLSIGETLGLVISSDSGLDLGQLDLSPLQTDFEILSRSSNTSISLINGASTSSMTLNLELAPRRAGMLSVPALQIAGQSSSPISIEVLSAGTTNPALDPSRDVLIEIEVDTEAPYVQQQLRYTVKLYYAISLSDGNLSEPSSDQALIERIGQDNTYRTQVQGRAYQAVERNYAITPQASGLLQIPPVQLSGRQASGRGFFDRGQPISVASRAVNLNVRPRPSTFTAEPWLPARSLAMSEQLSADTARVGEPLTRTITLAAVGLAQSLLPGLEMPDSDNYQVYTDQPVRSGSAQDGWLISQLEQKIAVVPSRTGQLQLPAMEVSWWDVNSDELKVAKIAARTIDVLPASNSAAVTAPDLSPGGLGALDSDHAAFSQPQIGGARPDPGLWPWIAASFALLWLLTLGLLWRMHRAGPKAVQSHAIVYDDQQAARKLAQACKVSDAVAAERAALALYAARGGVRIGSALALADSVEDPQLRELLIALDQRRYSPPHSQVGEANSRWDGRALLAAADKLRPRSVGQKLDPGALPGLYAGSMRKQKTSA